MDNFQKLDRPIFLVGCAKSGTTLLSVILSMHPAVGPKPPKYNDLSHAALLNSLLVESSFDNIAHLIEKKDIWDKYFPNPAQLRIGKELTLFKNPLSEAETGEFIRLLVADFNQSRFLSKQPFNTFRVHVLREIFPDCKIVAIHRDGRDVVASWGRKHKRWTDFGGYPRAIKLMAGKWNESINHLESFREQLGIFPIRYEDLVNDPTSVLRKILTYCELQDEEVYSGIALNNRAGNWKHLIPPEFHDLLHAETGNNLAKLGYIT